MKEVSLTVREDKLERKNTDGYKLLNETLLLIKNDREIIETESSTVIIPFLSTIVESSSYKESIDSSSLR